MFNFFINFIKNLFVEKYNYFAHKYNPGDIVEWIDYSWEGKDYLVRITDYYIDEENNVIYDVERLSDGTEYDSINEDEFILCATAIEMLEVENMMVFEDKDDENI